MLVVVDANIIMKDPLLRERKWVVAQTAIGAGRLRLVLPEVTRLEAVGGYRRDHNEKIRQIRSILRKSTDRARGAAEALLEVYTDEAEKYESILESRLREIGFETPLPPDHKHLELANRAVNRLPPFNETGGGYRDTLLWLTALDQIEEPPFDSLTLVSDDGVFTARKRELSEELHRETGAELTVARSITVIEFPDEYESGDFNLSNLEIGPFDIVASIKEILPGINISRWSPPGVDHAEVRRVGQVDILEGTVDVKKQYGTNVYEISLEAIIAIDAGVLIIHDNYGDEVDYSELSARWNLHVRWRGETENYRTRLSNQGAIEVLDVNEQVGPGR